MTTYELRIADDAFRRAEDLAVVLRVKATEALGMLNYLWRWVLTLKEKGAPDGIVKGRAAVLRLEAAARWDGIRGKFVEALVELGLVVREHRKIRVKGTKRYADEYARREAAKSRARESRERRKMAESVEPEQDLEHSRRETDQKRPDLISVERNAGTNEHGEPLPDNKLGLWTWMMRARSEICRIRPDRAPTDTFETWFERVKHEGIDDMALSSAWVSYLADRHFADRRWPVRVFLSEGVYRARLTQ